MNKTVAVLLACIVVLAAVEHLLDLGDYVCREVWVLFFVSLLVVVG